MPQSIIQHYPSCPINHMQEILNVTAVQTALHWESPAENRKKLAEILASSSTQSDVVVLPEMFTTGFTMNPQPYAEQTDGPTLAWMQHQAQQLQAALTGSFIVSEQNRYFNRLFWVFPDGRFETYDKRHLFRMAGEDAIYSAGKKQLMVTWKGWKIRPLICYDLRFPVWSRNIGNAYDLLIYVANWPQARSSAWRTLLSARAIENLSYVIGINRIGVDGLRIPYNGDSLILDFKGQVLWDGRDIHTTVTYPLSIRELSAFRHKFPAYLDADHFNIIS